MIVVDASAVLAATLNERGADRINIPAVARVISAVNACEVLTRLLDLGWNMTDAIASFDRFDFESVPFDAEQAQAAAFLRLNTRHLGISLGDRACLALAMARCLPVLTAYRVWASLDLGIEIRLVR